MLMINEKLYEEFYNWKLSRLKYYAAIGNDEFLWDVSEVDYRGYVKMLNEDTLEMFDE